MSKIKLYYVVFGLSVAFFISLFSGYYYVKKEVHSQIANNRKLISKNVENLVSIWFEKRVIAIEDAVKYLQTNDIYLKETKLQLFIKNFLNENRYFDVAQVLIPNLYFYANNIKEIDYTNKNSSHKHKFEDLNITDTKWFSETKNSLKTTINQIKIHGFLHEKTMNICTPIKNNKNGSFEGVFCGVFKVASLFNKIEQLNTFKNIKSFICDHEGNILTNLNIKNLKVDIQTCLENKQSYLYKENNILITITKLENFDWYIGTVVDLEEISKISNKKIFNHFLNILIIFVIIVTIIVLLHKLIIQKNELKNRQYEKILIHDSKMREIGKQVSMLNHQIIMPINSISLVVSNSLDMLEKKTITHAMLQENLKLCQKSTKMLNKTIDVFRNFYSQSENLSKFLLEDSFASFLDIIKIEANKKSIEINLHVKDEIWVYQRENFILQILMVLLQNSQTAICGTQNKTIAIEVKKERELIHVDVIDFGSGIDQKIRYAIFNEITSSKKSKGFGMGLYVSKKIAIEKIGGNLELIHLKNPTIFRLSFKQNLKDTDESIIPTTT